MIDPLLQAWKTALAPLQTDGSALEGLTGWVGHEQPVPTAELPGYSLDWLGEDPGPDGLQPGEPMPLTFQLSARLYIASLTKADGTPARTARDLYWRFEGATQFGLRPALRQVVRVAVSGVKFVLVPGEARALRKSQFPEARWSSAIEALVSARAVVART